MKLSNLLSLLSLLALVSAPLVAQESCSSPQVITLGTTLALTFEGSEPPATICAGTSIASMANWYIYTADSTGTLLISSAEGTFASDTRLHIYENNCDVLTCIGGDDDSGQFNSSIATIEAVEGESYLIVFDNRWTSVGYDFVLRYGVENPDTTVGSGAFLFTESTAASGAHIVDMNGDNLDDVLTGTSTFVEVDEQQPDGSFISTTTTFPATQNTPSWSLSAADMTRNGKTDLIYGGGNGATFLFASDDGTAYTESSDGNFIFCQRTNFVDLDNDGNLDAFTCHDIAPNVYYLNDGSGNLSFFQGGIGDTPDGGNYGSIWSDFDNDGDVDLFLSKCRGGNSPANFNQMHRNNGDGTFTDVAISAGLDDALLTWSSAIADYDNDGDMDIYVGASSNSNGLSKMMQNNGDMTFSDVTTAMGLDGEELGNSVEYYAYDFDNDGWVDIHIANGVILKNNGDMTFSQFEGVPQGAVGDINSDGFLDVMGFGTAYINDGNDNHHLTVYLEGTQSNIDGIGARVTVTSASGSQIRDVYSGVGFRYMHSLNAYFGLGTDETIESVTIRWPSGVVDIVENPSIDTPLLVVEGSTAVGIDEALQSAFSIFPTVTQSSIQVKADRDLETALYSVFDTQGKRVMNGQLQTESLDVSVLISGPYILRLEVDGKFVSKRFVKE